MHVTDGRHVYFDSTVGDIGISQVCGKLQKRLLRGWDRGCIGGPAEVLGSMLASYVGASDVSSKPIMEEFCCLVVKESNILWPWLIQF